jgi:hypothetical protein
MRKSRLSAQYREAFDGEVLAKSKIRVYWFVRCENKESCIK